MKCKGHMCKDKARDPVRTRGLVAWRTSEGLLIHPKIIRIEDIGIGWIWSSQRNEAEGGSVGSGERATVYSCVCLAITSAGVVIRRLEVSSLMMERQVEREGVSFFSVVVRRIDTSTTLGYIDNMRRRALPAYR